MIIIRYSEWDAPLGRWKEKLDELVVAYRLEQSPAVTALELQENGQVLKGAPAIDAFLKQLERDINDWRAPGCGV